MGPSSLSRESVLLRVERLIAQIDEQVSDQVNAILHHPDFQRAEASWRGLSFLVEKADVESESPILVRVLSVQWKELADDFEQALEFDQSQLFQKVYNEEFDMPGGIPFGVLLCDFEIEDRSSSGRGVDDLEVLRHLSQVAAAAFCPCILAVHPTFFGVRNFEHLSRGVNFERHFEGPEYFAWRSLREASDSRFVGLTLPRVLMREPYENDPFRDDGFVFEEEVAGPDARRYLWGTGVYSFGSVLIRAFADCGWLADIRGFLRGEETGGLVTDLPCPTFATDPENRVYLGSTDVLIPEDMERELGDQGFIPLCGLPGTRFSAFFGNQSIQKPKLEPDPAARRNAKMSSMLQYMFCSSRIAHYLKFRMLQKVGSFSDSKELQEDLSDWVFQYVAPDEEAPEEIKARYPLRDAEVQIKDSLEKPGTYDCIMRLSPHYQLDTVSATVELETKMRGKPKEGEKLEEAGDR